jgi:adenylate cyclase
VAQRQRLTAILALDIEDFASFQASNKKATLFHLRNFLNIVRDAVAENRGQIVSAERDTFLAEFASPVAAVQAVNAVHEDVHAYNEEQKEAQRMYFRGAVTVGLVSGEGREIRGEALTVAQALRDFSKGGATAVDGETFKQIEQRVDLEWEKLGQQSVGGKSMTVMTGVENIDAYASGGVGRRIAAGLGLGRRGIAAIVLGIILLVVATVFFMQQGPTMFAQDEATTDGGGSPFKGSIRGAMQKGLNAKDATGDDQGKAARGTQGEEATEDTANGQAVKVSMALPNEPSIAVLPFANASSDRSRDYIGVGLADEVSTALSSSPRLFVASTHSTRDFAASPDSAAEAARSLGVRFVLIGKTVPAGDRVRLAVQLLESGIDAPLMVRSYDLGPEDLPTAGRRIAQLVASAVGAALSTDDTARLRRQETKSAPAFDLMLRATNALRQENRAATDEAIRLYQAAVDADRSYARAYEGLASAHLRAQQWADAERKLDDAFDIAQRAVALDDTLPGAYSVLGASYLLRGDYDKAVENAEKAIAVNPNYADGYATLGEILTWSGAPERGAEEIEKALRRNPQPPFWYMFALGHARFLLHNYEGAIVAFRRGVESNPRWLPNRYFLAASYAQAGDEAKAQFELGQGSVRSVMPTIVSGDLTPYRDRDDLDHFLEAIRKAGVR